MNTKITRQEYVIYQLLYNDSRYSGNTRGMEAGKQPSSWGIPEPHFLGRDAVLNWSAQKGILTFLYQMEKKDLIWEGYIFKYPTNSSLPF